MKYTKIYFLIFFSFLSIGFIYDLSQISDINQKNGDINKNLITSTLHNSLVLEWNFTWGGNENEIPYDIALDSSGNIYISGTIGVWPDFSIFLAKFNSLGQVQWNRTTDKGGAEFGRTVALDSMNNIYAGGTFENISNGNRDIFLIKYDSLGNYQGNITWGSGADDTCNEIVIDSADNIYITGYTYNISDPNDSDIVLIKYDSLGNLQWNYTWGGNSYDYAIDIKLDFSDNIYLTGEYVNPSGSDIFLLKYNNLGEYQWNRTWDKSAHDVGTGIVFDSLNNVYVSGYALAGSYPNYDMVFIKYNDTGTMLWNRTWGKNYLDIILSIAIDSEDNLYLTGVVNYSTAKIEDFCLMQFNIDGEQQFNHTWGGPKMDHLYAIIIDSSNNIFLAGAENFGSSNSDVYLAKYSTQVDRVKTPEIFGYDLPLLILCISVSIGLLIKKKFKILK